MGFSSSAIRDAIQAQLQTIPGLRAYDTLSSVVNAPAAVVMWGDPAIEYDQAFEGTDKLRFVIVAIVALVSDRTAQNALDGYLDNSGATSIKTVVEGTLGGLVVDCTVTTATKPGVYPIGGVNYLGVRFNVEVMPT